MQAALNGLPGPPLANSDVTGRLLALWEDGLDRPDETLRARCEALHAREKSAGTEPAAILAVMDEWMGEEISRRMARKREEYDRRRLEMKEMAEQAFLSGADCKWTQVSSSMSLYCRMNGRIYRLSRTSDKKHEVYRVPSVEDAPGRPIGRYLGRPDATKAVEQVAYLPEPRW